MVHNIKREIHKCNSPILATGFHGYEHQDVAQMVIELLTEFCSNNDVKIIFNLFDEDTLQIYEK